MPAIPDFGWYGAGWAAFKSGKIPDPQSQWMPDFTDGAGWLQWLDGFGAAHADYPDEEAIEGMLEGDFSRGETFEAALERVAGPEVFGRIQGHLGRFITGNTAH